MIIDVRGRLWVWRDKRLILDERYNNPILDHNHHCYLNLALTIDGRIYNLINHVILELSYLIKRFIKVCNDLFILTHQGDIIRCSCNPITSHLSNLITINYKISYLLGIISHNNISGGRRLLVIDDQGIWKEINQDGEIMHVHDNLPNLETIIRVSNNYLITSEGLVFFELLHRYIVSPNWWMFTIFNPYNVIKCEIVDSIKLSGCINEQVYTKVLILDSEGNLDVYHRDRSTDYQYQGIKYENSKRKWIRLLSINMIGRIILVNDLGKTYELDKTYQLNKTNLPIEIFSPPPIKVKNARSN